MTELTIMPHSVTEGVTGLLIGVRPGSDTKRLKNYFLNFFLTLKKLLSLKV